MKTLTYKTLKDKLSLNEPMQVEDFKKIISILTIEQGDWWQYDGDFHSEKIELPNLRFENLTLQHLNLSRFDFSNSEFKNVVFKDCILVQSTFDYVKMYDCSFKRCNMTFTTIQDSLFVNTLFENQNFYFVDLERLDLKQCTWRLINFKHQMLKSIDFTNCEFWDVRFLGDGEFSGTLFPKDFDMSLDFSI